jgi:hypothetical protein
MIRKKGSPIATGVAAETHVYVGFGRTHALQRVQRDRSARVRAFLRGIGHAQLLRFRLD